MQQPGEASSRYSCATLRFVSDSTREITVPVGIVVWNAEERDLHFRLPRDRERLDGLAISRAIPFLEAAKAQLESWVETGELPYARDGLTPLTEAWWTHVRALMQFAVRVEPPRVFDCGDPERDLETLFDALVQPKRTARERRYRMEQAMRQAVGAAGFKRFSRLYEAPGFGGRPVQVLRGAQGSRAVVVMDGVNLALGSAETDADRLASKLGRVRENAAAQPVRFVLAYLASPGGLNGEGPLKDWIERQTESPLFDLDREAPAFAAAVNVALGEAGDELGVLAE